MTAAVPDILQRIVEHKRGELRGITVRRGELEKQAAQQVAYRRDFRGALAARRPAIIAEAKKASPSKGVLSGSFDAGVIAETYARGGAAALSVLTDREFFQGSIADLQTARARCTLPVLRKDFTFDEIHVIEAAAAGADAILLIAAILPPAEMRRFRELAESHKMAALVEVHDDRELDAAIESGASIIGVNNRNLHDFSVTLETSLRLGARIPGDVLPVSESGIHDPADVRRLSDAGFRAFLVGEHLMKSADPAAAIAALLGD